MGDPASAPRALVADGSRLTAAAVTVAAGLGYGVLLRRLARAGLLLPPEG